MPAIVIAILILAIVGFSLFGPWFEGRRFPTPPEEGWTIGDGSLKDPDAHVVADTD